MSFTTTPLLSGGVLVEGADSKGNEGTTILISDRWEMVKQIRAHEVAAEQFDAVVREFFQPLTEAADVAKAQLAGPASDWNKVTITEGTEFEPAQVIDLDMDGVLLRMLHEGKHDQLRWVGNDTLVAVV